MSFYYNFDGSTLPSIKEVGGKAYSLIRMTQHKLAVPPGFVLSTAFFHPWFQTLKNTAEWKQFLIADEKNMASATEQLKQRSMQLTYTHEQSQALEKALTPHADIALFAVRSSSPDEDLEGASFAGGYETVLGVTPDKLHDAIHATFASCLDQRVVSYKKQQHIDTLTPNIAIAIQQQIPSEKAGVLFSLNPVNNAYDEIMINANWGLGESVVSGIASPDLVIVDKRSLKVLQQTPGGKEVSLWLDTKTAKITEKQDYKSTSLVLSEKEIRALAQQIKIIDNIYQKAMDVEWAFYQNKLYILQARPITTQLQLSPAMLTNAREKKRLYLDILVAVQGIFQPLSPMGASCLKYMLGALYYEIFGKRLEGSISETLFFVDNQRLYLNLSNVMTIVSQKKVATLFHNIDTLSSDILGKIDGVDYRSTTSKYRFILPFAFRLPLRFRALFLGSFYPIKARQWSDKKASQYRCRIDDLFNSDIAFNKKVQQSSRLTAKLILRTFVPLFILSKITFSKIRKSFDPKNETIQKLINQLEQALPGNVTINMGLQLYQLRRLLPKTTFDHYADFEDYVLNKRAPLPFQKAWERFLNDYGHRGPGEFDIASARFRDQPKLLLEQLFNALTQNSVTDPVTLYRRNIKKREEAYKTLCGIAKKQSHKALKLFRKRYAIYVNLGGIRETHKYWLIYCVDKIRTALLEKAAQWVGDKTLDSKEQIFSLSLEDIEKNHELRATAEKNKAHTALLEKIKNPPRIIDSRGKMFFPPAPKNTDKNILLGQPVSSGTIKGKVKVLHTPDEKPLLPGEILVARATDPGWTPLFVNAAAILLEVGGVLQHGALVAREYGKPCVVGINNVTERLNDGDEVEVNGAEGTVHVLSRRAPT
jgi:rifampicin phosphotransferase